MRPMALLVATFTLFATPASASAMTCGEWLASRQTDATANNRVLSPIINFAWGYINALEEAEKNIENLASKVNVKITRQPISILCSIHFYGGWITRAA